MTLDPGTVVAIILFAGSIGVAALGWIKDTSSAKRVRDELAKLERRDARRNGVLMALRHYINVLTAWGAHSADPPPRVPPEPPDALTGDGQDD